MEIEKIIFDDSAGRVENRNGTEFCVFTTQSGKTVLFSRDKDDNIVKSFDGKLDSFDFIKSRGVAGQKLGRRFLKKETYSTTKVVTPAAAQPGLRPAWLNTRLADAHARQISPHTKDD